MSRPEQRPWFEVSRLVALPLLAGLVTTAIASRSSADESWATVVEERLSPASQAPSFDRRAMAGTVGFAWIRPIPDAVDPREAFGLSRLRGVHVALDSDALANASTNGYAGGGVALGTTWLPCVLDDSCGRDEATQTAFGLRLQTAYTTPRVLRGAPSAPVDERPYAGLTQVLVRVEQVGLLEKPLRGRGVGVAPARLWRLGFELGAGLLGPDAGGFELQEGVHRVLRGLKGCPESSELAPSSPDATGCHPRPEGWGHAPDAPYAYEVSNRPSIDVRVAGSVDLPLAIAPTSAAARAEAEGSAFTAALIDHARATAVGMHAIPAIMATPYARVDLGTTFVGATAGAQVRMGWLRVHHGLGVAQGGSWELALVGGVEGRLVGWNATIGAELVRGRTNVVASLLVGEARLGLLASTPLVDLSLAWVHRTSEISGPVTASGASSFAQLALSFHGD